MSESERRRGYRYNRVLIETARVLDPQFADAVVFLSGAQIEMLRNVTQYLNRLETYVTEYTPGYYLAPTVEDYDDILEIVADLEETLMGNPNTIWGYKDRLEHRITETSIGDPVTYAETPSVPAGYVHVVENISAHHTDGGTCGVTLTVEVGGADPILYTAPALPTNDVVTLPSNVTMKEGDYLQWAVTGLASTKLAILRVLGYTMVVP